MARVADLEFILKMRDQASAAAGLFVSNRVVKSALDAFGEYEAGLTQVAKTTNMTGADMERFQTQFDKMNRGMKGVDTRELLEVAGAAGQLGIRGVDNIVSFTEVLGKLSVATALVGEEGAKGIARVLNITGEGVGAIKSYGAVITDLGNNSAASEREIQRVATVLAQSTAAFHMTHDVILGLSAAYASLGMQPEISSTSTGRALLQMRDAALNATGGMRSLQYMTGLTAEQMVKMIDEHPDQALVLLARSLKAITDSGGSITGFLESLNLNTEESKRIFLTLGNNVDLLVEKLNRAKTQRLNPIALDQEAAQAMEKFTAQVAAAGKEWDYFKTAVGAALAPAATAFLEQLTSLLRSATMWFQSLGKGTQEWIAWLAAAVPAALALIGSLRVLGAAVGWIMLPFRALFGFMLSGFAATSAGAAVTATSMGLISGAANLAMLALKRLWPIALALVVGELAKSADDWFSDWAERNFGQATLDKLAAIRKEFEGFFDFMAQNPFTGVIQSGPNAGKNYWTGKTEYVKDDKGQWQKADENGKPIPEGQAIVTNGPWDRVKQQNPPVQDFFKDVTTLPIKANPNQLTEEQLTALKSFFGDAQKNSKVPAALKALEKLKASPEGSPDRNALGADDATIARWEKLLQLKLRYENPVNLKLDDLDKEYQTALAITQAQKDRVEVEQAIIDLTRERGTLDATEVAALTAKFQKLQAARRAAAFDNQTRGIQDQIAQADALTKAAKDRLEVENAVRDAIREQNYDPAQIAQLRALIEQRQKSGIDEQFRNEKRALEEQLSVAQALTQQEKDRLEILYQIQALQRDRGYSPQQAAEMGQLLEAKKQADAFASLRQQLDPTGQAQLDYAYKVGVLQKAMAAGTITAAQYQKMLQTLNLQTLDQRDPFAAQILSLQQQLALTKLEGQYREADKSTMETVLSLQKQGVTLTEQQIQQMAQLNRELQDAKEAQSTGISGWENSVGTLRSNLLDLNKDFASGLSGAISGALQGKKGSFSGFLNQLGGKMIDLSVNQLLKSSFQMTGLDKMMDSGAKMLGSTEQAKPFDMGLMKNLQTQMMTVAAGTVMVNGGVQGLPGVPGTTGGVPSNDNIPAGATAPVQTTSLPALPQGYSQEQVNVVAAAAAAAAAKEAVPSVARTSVPQVPAAGLPSIPQSIDAMKGGWSIDSSTFKQMAHGNSVDPRLLDILKTTSDRTGIKAEAFSGVREWGQGGQGHPSGLATDMRLFDPRTGKALANYQDPTTFRQYEQYAQAARQVQMEKYPELEDQFRWGGYFSGPKGKYGAMDSMHFDLMGRRGGLGMAGGSWEGGLTAAQRAYFPGAQSYGIGQGPMAPGQIPVQNEQMLRAGLIDRSAFSQQLSDPETRAKLFAMTHAEVGSQGSQAQQAFMESVMNRASSRGQSLDKTLSGSYFPQSTYDAAAKVDPALMEAKYAAMLQQVRGGSNISNFATGNASGRVGFAGGPMTAAYGGEKFGIEKYDMEWVKQQKLFAQQMAQADKMPTGSIQDPAQREAQMEMLREQMRARAMSPTAMNDNFQQAQQQDAQIKAQQEAAQQQMLQEQQMQALQQAQQAQQQYNQSLMQSQQQMMQTTPAMGQLGTGILGLGQQALSSIPGLGKFSGMIMQVVQQLLSSLGGGGGGGFFGSLLGGLFHGGGEVGTGSPTGGWRMMSSAMVASAPRFHTGLNNDEFPAILQRGERVLTRAQNDNTKRMVSDLTDAVATMSANGGGGRGGVQNTRNMTVVNNISTPNADSFRKSDGQRAADTAVLMQRMGTRNN